MGSNIRPCKFTPDGELRRGKDIDGSSGDDTAYALAPDDDDAIVVAGRMEDEDGVGQAWLTVFSP